MANSLLTGISGLRGHQKMLEVIGNNLANVNTTAFKTARTLFSDLMSDTQRVASSGTPGVVGSVNAIQIGTGSRVASVDLNFNQGNLESTGEKLDVAIDGNGFFVASDGGEQIFTRAGAFSLDEDGYLVDSSTGYLIQRFGTIGEGNGNGPVFQNPGDSRIHVPIGASVPGQATTSVGFGGQLGADATGPTQRIVQSTPLIVRATGDGATGATLLNDLSSTTTPFQRDPVTGIDDEISLIGVDHDGTNVVLPLSVNETSTVQDLVDGIRSLFPTEIVSLEPDGAIRVQATNTGQSGISLRFIRGTNANGNAEAEFFSAFDAIEPGRDATTVAGSVPIFDERGAEHALSFDLTKQFDNTWTMTFAIPGTSGVLFDNEVTGIQFNSDGSLLSLSDTRSGVGNIAIQFANSPAPTTIEIDLGEPGDFDGLSEIGATPDVSFMTDGAPPGELANVQIDTLGRITGIASNGSTFSMAQLAVASFSNPDGLTLEGSNFFSESLASGVPEIGTAGAGDRGLIRAGQLEGSNVDLALEFTRLLVAQRGFSANARTITVTDEMLEELTNIIR